ncbi:hypothetical protein GGR26_001212 [Lewinella marina]|uniref:LTD domain-containing protein n=1 Tax=Neolewinella marina TaxID=438751 RepID=A0A2G0CFT9_9BACT|nr:lamin tail domain-containing protein [Neolewinella marina]NJB85467.1 hypothetical protein [Neolewinella marina]PHK98843.1 hypothetical protein CGL56_10295 [Neolewinella marina]
MKPWSSLLIALHLAAPPLAGQAVQITEMMVDPTPVVGLPDAEYVEVYNAGNEAVDLSQLAISSGGRAVTAGAGESPLEAGEYAVLVREEYVQDFTRLGARAVALRLPPLANNGDEITLLLGADTVQHIRYTPAWYNDTDRDGGGYSLAYTGSGAGDCGGNWRASTHPDGGTPGRENEVYGQRADQQPPRPQTWEITEHGFTITFDEPVAGPVYFTVADLPLAGATEDGHTYHLAFPVERGQIYRLTVLADYADCAGNYADRDQVLELLLADDPAPGDLVINEILFDPAPGGSEFVEVVNVSSSAIDLNGLQLHNRNSAHRPKVIDRTHLLPAGGYVVFTPDRQDLLQRFSGVDSGRVVEMPLPSLPDAGGNITLSGADDRVLESVDYHPDYHNPLLSTVSGVSLERLGFHLAADVADHWSSASRESGFGTPTRPNSQAYAGTLPSSFHLAALSPTVSPDGDGFEDEYLLHYRADAPGYLANLHVFALSGRRVVAPHAASLLGTTGELSWDGRADDGTRVAPGPYVVVVELFTADGRAHQHKSVAVVAESR